MIAQLSGSVARTSGSAVILDVNGVGYKVFVPATVLERLPDGGEKMTLLTHQIVREDDLSLYGFLGETDLRVFEALISVSGVGPKAGLACLSVMAAEDLAQAVASEDIRTITRIPGIGPKTAQRMVLELKDKLRLLGLERKAEPSPGRKPVERPPAEALTDDAISALENLGYGKPDAARTVAAVLEEMTKAETTPEFKTVLRAALNRLTSR